MTKVDERAKTINKDLSKTSSADWHYIYVDETSDNWPSWKKEIYEKNFANPYQNAKVQKL